MASIQYDYSTLSTSMSHGDFGVNFNESNCDIIEETVTETDSSTSSCANLTSKIIPPDKFNLVYLIFGLIGIASLLPWNFFVTANDYWMHKLRDVNDTSDNPEKKNTLQALFPSYLSLGSNVPYVIFLILCTFINNSAFQHRRMFGSLISLIGFFVVITALVEINSDKWQLEFFAITMLIIILVAIASAVLQAAAIGVASVLPDKYMHSLVLGQAVAGVFAAVTQILSLLTHCDSVTSALTYFLIADFILLLTTAAYLWVQKSDFMKFFTDRNFDDTTLKVISGVEVKTKISLYLLTKQIWPYAITVLISFWVTIGIFPGIAVLVVSVSVANGSIWSGKLFLPLCCFLLFNVSDFCGRAVGGWLPLPSSFRYHLLFLSIIRTVLIPLFMLCNSYPRSHLPVVFNSDIYYVTFMTLLGFTNGYFVTVAMIRGTKFVGPQFQTTAGVILSAFLGGGLMLGAVSSYIFVLIL